MPLGGETKKTSKQQPRRVTWSTRIPLLIPLLKYRYGNAILLHFFWIQYIYSGLHPISPSGNRRRPKGKPLATGVRGVVPPLP